MSNTKQSRIYKSIKLLSQGINNVDVQTTILNAYEKVVRKNDVLKEYIEKLILDLQNKKKIIFDLEEEIKYIQSCSISKEEFVEEVMKDFLNNPNLELETIISNLKKEIKEGNIKQISEENKNLKETNRNLLEISEVYEKENRMLEDAYEYLEDECEKKVEECEREISQCKKLLKEALDKNSEYEKNIIIGTIRQLRDENKILIEENEKLNNQNMLLQINFEEMLLELLRLREVAKN